MIRRRSQEKTSWYEINKRGRSQGDGDLVCGVWMKCQDQVLTGEKQRQTEHGNDGWIDGWICSISVTLFFSLSLTLPASLLLFHRSLSNSLSFNLFPFLPLFPSDSGLVIDNLSTSECNLQTSEPREQQLWLITPHSLSSTPPVFHPFHSSLPQICVNLPTTGKNIDTISRGGSKMFIFHLYLSVQFPFVYYSTFTNKYKLSV